MVDIMESGSWLLPAEGKLDDRSETQFIAAELSDGSFGSRYSHIPARDVYDHHFACTVVPAD